jgi:hypothetical protein
VCRVEYASRNEGLLFCLENSGRVSGRSGVWVRDLSHALLLRPVKPEWHLKVFDGSDIRVLLVRDFRREKSQNRAQKSLGETRWIMVSDGAKVVLESGASPKARCVSRCLKRLLTRGKADQNQGPLHK